MTFRRMSKGFVCSSQWDKERDLNKSIYPRRPSTQPPFVRSVAQCRAAGWHHTMPRHPKGAQGLSFPIVLGRFWETLQAAVPLAPSPKVAAEPQREEGTDSPCKTAAADGRCSLDSSSLLPRIFGPLAPRNGPCHFFSLCQTAVHTQTRGAGGGVHAPPGQQHGASPVTPFLSPGVPPRQDRIRPSKPSQKQSAYALCHQGYPLQVPAACNMVQESKMLKPPEPSPSSGLLA